MPDLFVPAASPTFSEYQAIHQTQQERRNPSNPNRRPNTSDSLKNKVKYWLAAVLSGGALSFGVGSGKFLGWVIVITLFTGLGLLHQWWEYRRAYRDYAARPKPTAFRLFGEGLRIEEPSNTLFYRWESFYRIDRIDEWLLFYTSIEHCYYLDLRQVSPPATPADVLNLLPRPEVAVT